MTTALAFVALAGWALLQLWITPHPWQPDKSLHQVGVILAGGLAYLAASELRLSLTRVLWALTALLVPVALWTWHDPRGPFSYAGTAAACCLGLAALAGHHGGPLGPWLAIAAAGGVWASGSRAAALAGLLAFAAPVVVRARPVWATLAGGAAGGAVWFFPGLLDPAGRWRHWYRALHRAEFAPWLGTGLLSEHPELAHNDWLQVRADLGWIGLAAFLVAVGSSLWAMRRSRAPWLVAGAVALICQSAVDFPLTHPVTLCLFCTLAGAAAAATPEEADVR